MDALDSARTKAKEGHVLEAADEVERALRLAPDHPERHELAGFLLAAARDPASATQPAERRESRLFLASLAGGDELAATLATELRGLHADVLAARGVSDRTLTGAPSAVPVAEPRRNPKFVAGGALAAFALALAWAGEVLRRRAKRGEQKVQAAPIDENATTAEVSSEEPS